MRPLTMENRGRVAACHFLDIFFHRLRPQCLCKHFIINRLSAFHSGVQGASSSIKNADCVPYVLTGDAVRLDVQLTATPAPFFQRSAIKISSERFVPRGIGILSWP